MDQINVVRDPRFTIFLTFYFLWNILHPAKMVKSPIYVVLFRRIFYISQKIFSARPYSKTYQKNWFNLFRGTLARLRGIFQRRSFPSTKFFWRKKFDFRCVTFKFGIFKMCKYLLYILTCIHGCNKWRVCRSLLTKHTAKSRVSGSKSWAKFLSACFFFIPPLLEVVA